MSRLQAIENALIAINDTVFQELCDSFLALRNSNYSAFSRTGSQSGKQKTVKGTPDTFFLLPNGKYLFVEHSTNITEGLSKLKKDVKNCIDTSITGIPVSEIEEIILCVNFNLKAEEIQKLKDLLSDTRITLSVYTLDALAIELHLRHRDLTHHYLGLPLDTGQVVSIEKFIEEYNRASKGIATPLNNTFLHREQELKELNEAISHNDFLILTGAPGVGKTKLAIESIKAYLKENLSFEAFCVSYKNHTLLEDLFQYFDSEKDYILFVDDANRIDAFNQIIGFYKASRRGKLKILITARDYAFQEVGMLCQEFLPKRIDLLKLTDKEVIDIIKAEPFGILNSDYHKEIVRIADGNPRLAIMAALLAFEKQNIYALADVSDLFESYFTNFIKDDGEFVKTLNIQCLGLIGFFHTIPYKNRSITTSILDNFNIDYLLFIEAIDKLDKLELVEIQFEHVKIPEQNLSTFFFYKAFIKDGLLSFEKLLNKYFDTNSNRFRDCVIPANNTFGYQNVMQKLQPHLQNHWKLIQKKEVQAFKFLSTFWYYLQNETLEFVFNIVESLPAIVPEKYETAYENNVFSRNRNEVIELLGEFFRSDDNLKDAIELAFEYIRKLPKHLPELIHKVKEQLTFDREDERFDFLRQNILYQILIEKLNQKDVLYAASFFELSKTFLSFKFHYTRSGRNYSIYWYDYTIPNSEIVQKFRRNAWDAISNNFGSYPKESFDLLQSYTQVHPDVSKEIMEYDMPYLVEICQKYLSTDSFEHCRYVQNQIRWCKRNGVSHTLFPVLESKFTNYIYEVFLKIDWNRYRDRNEHDFVDHNEYYRLKEAEIRSFFIFKNEAELKAFYDIFAYLKSTVKNNWKYETTLDLVIDENCSRNFNLGCELLTEIIKRDNEVNFIPRIVFINHLRSHDKAEQLWSIVQKQKFANKIQWELAFFDFLDDFLVDEYYAEILMNSIVDIEESCAVYFNRLQRFLVIKPDLFQNILKIIVEKNREEKIRVLVWTDFFSDHFNQLGDDIELIKEAYLQQDKIHDHFDYEKNGFLNILNRDKKFLFEYIVDLYSLTKIGLSGEKRNLSCIWEIENIEPVLKNIFDLCIDNELYFGFGKHFSNSFFRSLNENAKMRAKKFLISYCKESFMNSDKMNIIVDVVRHSMSDLFGEILLLFLSLCQDREIFSKIWWRGNGGTYSGDVIIGDIKAADWQNILSIVNKSTVGMKLIPIKKYINEQIESAMRYADGERLSRFLERR